MQAKDVIDFITSQFDGVTPKASWGETSLFYNPQKQLPNGVYFCTIKEKNGDNDKASDLDRDSVFRLSIGISQKSYVMEPLIKSCVIFRWLKCTHFSLNISPIARYYLQYSPQMSTFYLTGNFTQT